MKMEFEVYISVLMAAFQQNIYCNIDLVSPKEPKPI